MNEQITEVIVPLIVEIVTIVVSIILIIILPRIEKTLLKVISKEDLSKIKGILRVFSRNKVSDCNKNDEEKDDITTK